MIELRSMDQDGWNWFNRMVPVLCVEDSCGMTAYDTDKGKFVAGMVMDNWTDTSCQGHFCITTPMILRAGFFDVCTDYVFNERGMKLFYASVPSQYEKALKFLPQVGFTEVVRLKDAFKEGVDCVIMELKKENVVRIAREAA